MICYVWPEPFLLMLEYCSEDDFRQALENITNSVPLTTHPTRLGFFSVSFTLSCWTPFLTKSMNVPA
jgi:hypothetical protein